MDYEPMIAYLKDLAAEHGPGVAAAAATLLIGWIAAKIITGMLRRLMNRARIDPTLSGFAGHLAYMVLLTLVVITAIQKLGVPTASFVAVVGAAGLAVGFAMQGSLANFAAGTLIILFRPFSVGHYIEAGGVSGTVENIEVFVTTLNTPDNKRVIVPNSSITGGTITNYSANDTRRVDMVFGIGYGDDIKKAKQIIQSVLDADERVLKDPAPVIAVAELADSSVNILARPWTKSADYWNLLWETKENIKAKFDEAGINIPYPQRDIHVHQVA